MTRETKRREERLNYLIGAMQRHTVEVQIPANGTPGEAESFIDAVIAELTTQLSWSSDEAAEYGDWIKKNLSVVVVNNHTGSGFWFRNAPYVSTDTGIGRYTNPNGGVRAFVVDDDLINTTLYECAGAPTVELVFDVADGLKWV